MQKTIIAGIILCLFVFSCKDQTTQAPPVDTRDILEKLQSLPNLQVAEITPQNGYERQFEIYITQPLDHNNPGGPQFQQQIFLSHRDESAPVVFMPSGYSARATTASELSGLLQANQIYVPHRFMDGARPSPMDWQFNTTEQAAADHHRVVGLFKEIYQGIWVSYGASKNGATALFHRRFYPDDVDATVAKVAPISLATEDPRYDVFLENVGDEASRNKIKQYQIALLKNRDEILPMINTYMNNSPLHYSVSEELILEFEACEYAFSFWQVTDHDTSTIPDTSSTAQALYHYLESEGYFPLYSDEYMNFYEPVFYQFYTELGYYQLITDHLQGLLVTLPNPSYSYFAPQGIFLNFNPAVMEDVLQWLQTEGNHIIYIYGELDPWTAGAVELTGQTNAIKIVQAGANHYINIADLDEKALVYSTLESWLGVDINEGGLLSIPEAPGQKKWNEYQPKSILLRQYISR
jgi:hypothetical protein